MNMESVDGLHFIQASKFAKRFKLSNLRMVNGYWVADDGDCEAYRISRENYYGAEEEGDLE